MKISSIEKYKRFEILDFTKEDLESLGYNVVEKHHHNGHSFSYHEFILTSCCDGSKATALLNDIVSDNLAIKEIFSDISSFSKNVSVCSELHLFRKQKYWTETRRIKIEKSLNLCKELTFENLLFCNIIGISSFEISLSGDTHIGNTRLFFKTILDETDGMIKISFNPTNNKFPSFDELLQHILGDTKIIQNISNIFDIRLRGMALNYNYKNTSIEYLSASTDITLGVFLFRAYFSYPNTIIHGVLQQGCRPTFSSVAKQFKINRYPETLEKLYIEKAAFNADLSSSYYGIDVLISGELDLDGVLTLTSLALNLDYSDNEWHADFSAALSINNHLDMQFKGHFSDDGLALKGLVDLSGYEQNFWELFKNIKIPKWITNLSLQTASISHKKEELTVAIDFHYNGADIKLSISIKNKNVDIGGIVVIDGREFKLEYAGTDKENILYVVIDGDITISLNFIGLADNVSIDVKNVYFVMYNTESGTQTALGVGLKAAFDFKSLPIVGDLLHGKPFKIDDISLCYNSTAFDENQKRFITNHGVAVRSFNKGVLLDGRLSMPTGDIMLGMDTDSNPSANIPVLKTTTPVKEEQKIKYHPVNKDFGVIYLSSVGFGVQDSAITILLNSSITLGCFRCVLIDAGISASLTSISKPDFKLGGISFDYKTPILTIGGNIQKINAKDMDYCYNGGATVQLSKYGLIADTTIGKTTGKSDLEFSIYFASTMTIIVSPSVIITQLSGAFGYNEQIREPKTEDIAKFPLVTGNRNMSTWTKNSVGDYWMAASVRFNVAEILNGSLLLLAKFGHDLAFDIIGKADITLPKGTTLKNAYLHADINILASLHPNEGTFNLTAILDNQSFLLSDQCKLSGGLAFSMWFGENTHSGDYVLTIGGYHPAFFRPSHYPVVPRVGFLWNINNNLSVKGEAYLALTPSCIMAGGRLEAVYETSIVRAWFIVVVDLLIAVHPFYFDAKFAIDIGVQARVKIAFIKIKITVNVGANLHLFGPPTTGTLKVHISVLTFTIFFGDGHTSDKSTPLLIKDFRLLLPEQIHSISISKGLIGEKNVQPHGVQFFVGSAIPIGLIDIRLMNKENIFSNIKIDVEYKKQNIYNQNWNLTPILANVPQSLWGKPLKNGKGEFMLIPKLPSVDTLLNQTTGYFLEPPKSQWGEKIEWNELVLWSNLIPSLKSGEYILSVNQSVAEIASLNTITKFPFTVQKQGKIIARYPDKNETGAFDNILPHIIFLEPSYLFETELVLITLSKDEFEKFDEVFIKNILPSSDELPYFKHIRQVSDNDPAGVIFSCRFPCIGENHACLLELDITKTSFKLLDSWTFQVTSSPHIDFAAVVKQIVKTDIPTIITTQMTYTAAFENARLKVLADTQIMQSLFALRTYISENSLPKSKPISGDNLKGLLGIASDCSKIKINLSDVKNMPKKIQRTKKFVKGEVFKIPNDKIDEATAFAKMVYKITLQKSDSIMELFLAPIPKESISFFKIDKDIVKNAIDGVFSVGIESNHDKAVNKVLYDYVSAYIFDKIDGDLNGFILNSSLLEKWEGTKIQAFDKNRHDLPLFESRTFPDKSLKLNIYKGNIHKITLLEPLHILSSGLTPDGGLMVKLKDKSIKLTEKCFKKDGKTVVLKEILNLSGAKNPAQFGLDLLRVPEKETIEV